MGDLEEPLPVIVDRYSIYFEVYSKVISLTPQVEICSITGQYPSLYAMHYNPMVHYKHMLCSN